MGSLEGLSPLVGLGNGVGDEEVVEDSSRLHLPEIETKESVILIARDREKTKRGQKNK